MKKATAFSVLGAFTLAGMLVRAAFIYFDVGHPAIWVFPLTHFESIFGGLMVGLGMALILSSVMQGGLWPLSLLFKNRLLGCLGKVSYGLYVYHLAGLKLAFKWADVLVSPERLLVYPLVGTALGLVVTVLFSVASYELLEKPFLCLKERFAFIQTRPV